MYLEVLIYTFLASGDLQVRHFKATFWLNGDLKYIPVHKHVLKKYEQSGGLHFTDINFIF